MAPGALLRQQLTAARKRRWRKESAATRTFRATELLENVLSHMAPLELFALRRVSPKFQDVITLNKSLRKQALLDRQNTLRLYRLTMTLRSRKIDKAIYPLKITSLSINTEGRYLKVGIAVDPDWVSRYWRFGGEGLLREGSSLPCHRKGSSWREIRIEHPGYCVLFVLEDGFSPALELGSPEVFGPDAKINLGKLVGVMVPFATSALRDPIKARCEDGKRSLDEQLMVARGELELSA